MLGIVVLFISLPILLFALDHGPSTNSVSLIYEFPLDTWIENLAVRSNGLILGTKANVPELWQVDPNKSNPAELIAVIPDHLALSGIVEVVDDVFYVGANNFTLNPPGVQPNSSAVYRVDLKNHSPGKAVTPSLVVNFKVSGLLNGFTRLSRQYILIADAGLGLVYRLDVGTGEVRVVISDPLMAVIDTQKEPIGVNGLKVKHGWLYWSNTNQELLAKIPISTEGEPKGKAEVVIHYSAPDDFLIAGKRDSFIVAGNDQLRRIDAGTVTTLSDDALLKGSTAVQFARGWGSKGKLYVSTNGGVEQYSKQNVTVPGRLVEVDLGCDN